jgi:hypothetical protein
MTSLDVIRNITIQGRTEGVDTATGQLRQLAEAPATPVIPAASASTCGEATARTAVKGGAGETSRRTFAATHLLQENPNPSRQR